MDIRTREELKKEIQKFSNNEKIVLGDSSFNVCVNRKFLFPYNQLDIVRDVLADTVKDFTIYFVVSCGRKEIKSFKIDNESIILTYCDIDNRETNQLVLSISEKSGINPFFIPFFLQFFEYEICKSGSSFKIYISEENMVQLRIKYPRIFDMFPEECKKSNLFYMEYDIYNLIWENRKNDEKIVEYELLYIGKSNAEKSDFDILKRLSAHETIQKIIRENNLYYRSKELSLMIFSFNSKLYREYEFNYYNTNILLGNSNWEKDEILLNIRENQEVILLIEAILINHFKPKYNQQYIKQISINSKIYQVFKKQKIDPIWIELDLSMDDGKVILKTREKTTETKMRILKCLKKNERISIEYDDISDFMYDIC